GNGIAVDGAGSVYVAGQTDSANFPLSSAVQATFGGTQDAFVTKLNASGSALVYSTYLGGDDYEIASSIAVDTADNAYVTGDTFSGNFPLSNALQSTLAGTQDAFVTKLNSSGTALVYSTYLGGNNTENARGIETDGAGNAYITGNSASPDFPISSALQPALAGGDDAFVTKLNANGTALVYSTYLGGNGDDFGFGITIDSNHDAYVTGSTR